VQLLAGSAGPSEVMRAPGSPKLPLALPSVVYRRVAKRLDQLGLQIPDLGPVLLFAQLACTIEHESEAHDGVVVMRGVASVVSAVSIRSRICSMRRQAQRAVRYAQLQVAPSRCGGLSSAVLLVADALAR
jgi:hypothetical protein